MTPKELREAKEIEELKTLHKKLTAEITDKEAKNARLFDVVDSTISFGNCELKKCADKINQLIKKHGEDAILDLSIINEDEVVIDILVYEDIEVGKRRAKAQREWQYKTRYEELKSYYPEIQLE